MGRPVITATDVLNAGRGGTLQAPSDAIITPLARDTARDKDVTIVVGAPVQSPSAGDISQQVRTIVERLLAGSGGDTPAPGAAVKHASIRDVELDPFPYPGPPPGMDVRTRDVVTDADGSPMAAGYMSITKGQFPWTLNYDEVQIVLEGELHLGGDARGKVGRAGDVLYVPKGSSITFGTPTFAKFVYVTFPANWEDA
ncbi:ethanolamine utilization protein EutQ [Tessaracoccus lapidicaptus]|uniref:Ethanolamine utilization protein EutQ n=1 Tax=Tessaracoccus lapidicaptus TaxID=1427523 RepID=A0A1C0AKL9_9ACTN|nr:MULTISPECIES: cupin domain-containing protein [Tessaracoccus]AQX16862.1 ethanolamine utilization protein EutQ [Tessaracoccus sp. T2.5-30]OCL33076.1 ethanolamine utilization protein EutQ [Tessaracoccus lapidicaptus]VEP41651.1 Ethanolamine utilization protein EutQ [Tessaracoccus lapidicaptus]